MFVVFSALLYLCSIDEAKGLVIVFWKTKYFKPLKFKAKERGIFRGF